MVADAQGGRRHRAEINQTDLVQVLRVHEFSHEVQVLSPVQVGVKQVVPAAHRAAGQFVEPGQMMRMVPQRCQQCHADDGGNHGARHPMATGQPLSQWPGQQKQTGQQRQDVADAQLHG